MYGEDETVQQLKDEEARAEKLVEMFERDVNNSPLYMMNQQLEYLIYSSTVDDYTKKKNGIPPVIIIHRMKWLMKNT